MLCLQLGKGDNDRASTRGGSIVVPWDSKVDSHMLNLKDMRFSRSLGLVPTLQSWDHVTTAFGSVVVSNYPNQFCLLTALGLAALAPNYLSFVPFLMDEIIDLELVAIAVLLALAAATKICIGNLSRLLQNILLSWSRKYHHTGTTMMKIGFCYVLPLQFHLHQLLSAFHSLSCCRSVHIWGFHWWCWWHWSDTGTWTCDNGNHIAAL